jgi:hypothetical protein
MIRAGSMRGMISRRCCPLLGAKSSVERPNHGPLLVCAAEAFAAADAKAGRKSWPASYTCCEYGLDRGEWRRASVIAAPPDTTR